jgi:cytochrome b6-f complex iron-sulfur subunit
MTRKDFFTRVGFGAVAVLVPACIGGLVTSCTNQEVPAASTTVDFTLDISLGALATNGGYLVRDGVIVARTLTGSFIAVSAACTHQGTTVDYSSADNGFICPNHGAQFSSTGLVTRGPATADLTQYNTALTGNSLRVFS